MAINIIDMKLAQRFKETVSVTREGRGKKIDVATDIEAVILPNRQPATILPTGETTPNFDFYAYLLVPNTDIKVTDTLHRGDLDLTVDDIYHVKANDNSSQVMRLGLRK